MAEINEALDVTIEPKVDIKALNAQLKLIQDAYSLAIGSGNNKAMDIAAKKMEEVSKQIKAAKKAENAERLAKLRAEHPESITFLDLSASARKKIATAVKKTGALPYEVQIRKGLKAGMTTMVGAQSAYRTTRNIAAINSGNAAAAEAGYAALEQEQARAVTMQIASKERRRLNLKELKASKKEYDALPEGWHKTILGKHIVQISKTMAVDRRYTKKNRETIAEIGDSVSKQLDLMKGGTAKTAGAALTAKYINTLTSGIWAGNGRTPITNLYNNAVKSSGMIGGGIGAAVGGAAGGFIGAAIGELVGSVADLIHEPWRMTAKRAFTIRDRKALLGSAYNHNFTENMAEMYGINEGALVSMTENARYFKARAAFGQVSESEMMGSMLLPNFHNAMINGGGTADLVNALQRDIAERGQDNVYMGLKMKGLSTDLMSLSGVNFERALQGTQEQEAQDIANILNIIREWSERSKTDLDAMRMVVGQTYEGNKPNATQRFMSKAVDLYWRSNPVALMTGNSKPLVIQNTTNVNLDGSTIKTDKSERQVMNTWVGMSTPAR